MVYARKSRRGYKRRGRRMSRKHSAVTIKKTKKVRIVTAKSFNKLAKQVRMNTAKAYGKVQCNYQLLGDSIALTNTSPVAFDTTDFTAFQSSVSGQVSVGARIYRWNPTTSQVDTPSNWSRQDFVDNPFWQSQNKDVVSGGSYKPIYSKITIRVAGVPTITNCRVRFDLIKAKRGSFFATNVSGNVLMPQSLEHLQNLATPTLNKISPYFFKIIQTKWVTLNSSHFEGEGSTGSDAGDAPPQGTTVNFKYVTFKIRRKSVVKQIITRPRVDPLVNDAGQFTPAQSEIDDGNYGPLNRTPHDPMWLVCSCSDSPSTIQSVSMTACRVNWWRDPTGEARII